MIIGIWRINAAPGSLDDGSGAIFQISLLKFYPDCPGGEIWFKAMAQGINTAVTRLLCCHAASQGGISDTDPRVKVAMGKTEFEF